MPVASGELFLKISSRVAFAQDLETARVKFFECRLHGKMLNLPNEFVSLSLYLLLCLFLMFFCFSLVAQLRHN
jgi:hypothetical protein